jgi:hypothetical protein
MLRRGIVVRGENAYGFDTAEQVADSPITVWVDASREPAVTAFQEAYPDIDVVLETYDGNAGGSGSFQSKISLMVQAGRRARTHLRDGDRPRRRGHPGELRQPRGRMVTPEEVAGAIAYLASPRSGSTTGTALEVDGGVTHVRARSAGARA